MIDAARIELGITWASAALLSTVYEARTFVRGPQESPRWVELKYTDYFCRSFPTGTSVGIYAQIARAGWREICVHSVTVDKDVTMTLEGQWSTRTASSRRAPRLRISRRVRVATDAWRTGQLEPAGNVDVDHQGQDSPT